MNDQMPTVRRLAAAARGGWRDFSYKDSIAARGAVWTLVCWGLVSALAFLVLVLPEYGRLASEGASRDNMDLLAPVLLAIIAGSPLMAFIAGAGLSGGALGFLDSLKRGAKAASFPAGSLLILAAVSMFDSSEKAGLAAAILFWIGALSLLTGTLAGLLRWLGGRVNSLWSRGKPA